MSKLKFILLIVASLIGAMILISMSDTYNGSIYVYYSAEEEMRPGQTHYMEPNMWFDEYDCLIAGFMSDEDKPCLEILPNGCITRAGVERFHGFWKVNIPKPNIPLCVQAKELGFIK